MLHHSVLITLHTRIPLLITQPYTSRHRASFSHPTELHSHTLHTIRIPLDLELHSHTLQSFILTPYIPHTLHTSHPTYLTPYIPAWLQGSSKGGMSEYIAAIAPPTPGESWQGKAVFPLESLDQKRGLMPAQLPFEPRSEVWVFVLVCVGVGVRECWCGCLCR